MESEGFSGEDVHMHMWTVLQVTALCVRHTAL
jgi:hypothetical protein